MKFEERDEILEIIWTTKEKKNNSITEIHRQLNEARIPLPLLQTMIEEEGVQVIASNYELSGEAELRARTVIRQHRLGEIVMAQVLDSDSAGMEAAACAFEHSLVPEITDGICTLLGHPPKCPHGNPIPQGECCKKKEGHIESSAIVPLTKLAVGETARVAYILSSGEEKTLHFLNSLGVHPGSSLKLHQTYPTYVVEQGNTQLAMEESIAESIYLWKKKS